MNRPNRGDEPENLAVEVARPEEREAALSLLLNHLPPEERTQQVRGLLASSAAGELSLGGLLVARRHGRRIAAGFFAPQPGRAAFVWPPAVDEAMNDTGDHGECSALAYAEVAGVILRETGRRLDAAGVSVGQCLIDPASRRERLVLDACGFPGVTELEFLHCGLHGRPPHPLEPSAGPTDWSGQPFTPGRDDNLFAELLERSAVETADCPELNGLRSGMDCLAGHRAAGEHDPALWLAYCAGGEPVAVLLMTAHADRHAWEIVYLGVVPEMRGRGFGRRLVADALARARRAGQGGVFLAVDRRNIAARRIYAQAGFLPVGRQAVHLRLRAFEDSPVGCPSLLNSPE